MATTGASTGGYTRVIENVVLTDTLKLNGPEWNNTLVRNVTILNTGGDGIFLQNVKNVRIENSTIHDVSGSGIRLSMSGSTSDVQIADNNIYNIGRNGINAGQRIENGVDHLGLEITGNTVHNTGTSGTGGLLHGMYIQGSDFLIEGNHITGSTDGNAISVRTSGIIRDNVIEGTGKSGISYYADHMTGKSDTLVIEGNIVMDTGNRQSRTDIDLLPVPDADNVVHNFIIRNNTLTNTKNPIGVNGDYSSLGIKPTISNNTVVSESAAKAAAEQKLAGGGEVAEPAPEQPAPGGDDDVAQPAPGGDDDVAEPTPEQPVPGGEEPAPEQPAPGGNDDVAGGQFTIKVRASADLYKGGAKMQVALDGQKIGPVETVDANHAKGKWSIYTYEVDADTAPEQLSVSFLNDLYGGKGKDRDLWIDYVEVNGHRYEGSEAEVTAGRANDVGSNIELLTKATITWDLVDPMV